MHTSKVFMVLTFFLGQIFLISAQSPNEPDLFSKGKSSHEAGRYDSARIYLEKSLQAIDAAEEPRDWVRSMNWLGWTYMDLALYRQADSALQQALTVGEEQLGAEDVDVAFTCHILAKTYGALSRHDSSMAYVLRALAIRKKILGPKDLSIAQSYEMLSYNFRFAGQYDSAIHYYNGALEILFEKVGKNHLSVARIYSGLAWVYGARGALQKSLDYNGMALKIRSENLAPEHPLILNTLSHNCWCYNAFGNYPRALECDEQVLALRKKKFGDDHPLVALSYINVGRSSARLGDYEKAIAYYLKSTRLLEDKFGTDFIDLVRYYGFIASSYRFKGDTANFLYYVQKAIKLGERSLDAGNPELVQSYKLLSIYYWERGEYEKQREYIEKGMAITEDIFGEKHSFMGILTGEMGMHYQSLNRYREAHQYHTRSLKITKAVFGTHHPSIATQLDRLAALSRLQHQYDSALFFYQQALHSLTENFKNTDVYTNPVADQVISELPAVDIFIHKGETFLQIVKNTTGKERFLKAAAECFDMAIGLVEKMRNGYTTEDAKQQLFISASHTYDLSITTLRRLYVLTGSHEYLIRAFQISERSKSFILLNTLNNHRAQKFAGVPDTTIAREQALKAELAYFKKKLFRSISKGDSSAVNQLHDEIFKRQFAYEQLIAGIEEEIPEYYGLKYDHGVASPNDVAHSLLRDGQAVLEYFVTENHIHLFSIEADTVRWYDMAIPENFKQLVEVYRKSTSDYAFIVNQSKLADQFYLHSANALYELLLSDAIADLDDETDRLVIVADDILGQVNFDALLTEKVDVQAPDYTRLPYLLRDYQISHAYSVSFLNNNQDRIRNSASYNFGGFAPTYRLPVTQSKPEWHIKLAGRRAPLSGAIAEVTQIAAMVEGDTWLGTEATESNFKANARDYNMIHLAMHGSLDDINPLFSKLLFAEVEDSINDGQLDLSEIYNLRLNADLVVLSACNTGNGKIQRGEGNMSLSRAFSYAGCPSVIMSLWKIPDAVTSNIMVKLYSSLVKEDDKDVALRSAKLDYLNETTDPLHGHPYFWAGFVLMGDTQSITLNNDIAVKAILLILALVVILLIVYIVLKKFRTASNSL